MTNEGSLVTVVFNGVIHAPLNLEATDTLSTEMSSTFSQHRGKRIVFLEHAGADVMAALRYKGDVERLGFLKITTEAMLGEEWGRVPTSRETRERMRDISRTKDLAEVLRRKLIHPTKFFSYFIDKTLDEVRDKYPFDTVFECHSQSFNEQDHQISAGEEDLEESANTYWDNGEFDLAVSTYKELKRSIMRSGISRNPDIISLGKKSVEQLLRGQDGGVLYMVFGVAHEQAAHDIAAHFSDDNVDLQVVSDVDGTMPDLLMAKGIELGTDIDDLVYARGFLLSLTNKEAFYAYTELVPEDLEGFARSYGSFVREVVREINLLSLDDIRNMCEKQRSLIFTQED